MVQQKLADIIITPAGQCQCLYTEAIDLSELGSMTVRRVSNITFNEDTQQWEVKYEGYSRVLFKSKSREACVAWEQENLMDVILGIEQLFQLVQGT